MEKYCENCGAKLSGDSQFCPECGKNTEKLTACPKCGQPIDGGERFCAKCGTRINAPQSVEKKNTLEKYKVPIIITAVLIIAILAGIFLLNAIPTDDTPITLPPQTVTVGSEYFKIPGNFRMDSPMDIRSQDGVNSFSQSWSDGYDGISIMVMSTPYNVDLQSVISSQGGVHKTLMGYDGYYAENDINDYSFAFILNNKICVIETTSPYLFDNITVE